MTRIEIIGFAVELMMFAVAVYLYLYSTNIITTHDRAKRKRQEEFIASYGNWMRPLSLALMAITAVNILFRFVQ